MANDNELISRAQSGDEQAFAELVRVYYPFVHAIVIRIVNNPLDAEEVVQDTFVNVYHGLAQYEEIEKFKNWLAKIARNCARNRLRKQQIDTVPIDEVNAPIFGTQDLPDEQLIRSEQRELIRRAMETLSPKDREIARSYYLDGASYDELIQTHGLSYKAISVRLVRAKQKLAKRLGHLLTGIFVTPATTLKQIYSGGLTVMKIGTASKITVGAIGILALIFVGIGVHQIILPKDVKDTASSVQPTAPSEELVETDTNQEADNRENQPQISDQDMEQINNFFAQLDETDMQSDTGTAQSPTESKTEPATTDTDASTEDTEPSAEEMMTAYVEAFKNGDFEALFPLVTGTATKQVEEVLLSLSGEVSEEFINAIVDNIPEGMSEEMVDNALQMMLKVLQDPERQAERREQAQKMYEQMYGQAEIVSSEYVGDEFHFRLRMPAASPPEVSVKMQKVEGIWLVYDVEPVNGD
jgi:RNA polymerase sigma-70 factor (ECF subfamily)